MCVVSHFSLQLDKQGRIFGRILVLSSLKNHSLKKKKLCTFFVCLHLIITENNLLCTYFVPAACSLPGTQRCMKQLPPSSGLTEKQASALWGAPRKEEVTFGSSLEACKILRRACRWERIRECVFGTLQEFEKYIGVGSEGWRERPGQVCRGQLLYLQEGLAGTWRFLS